LPFQGESKTLILVFHTKKSWLFRSALYGFNLENNIDLGRAPIEFRANHAGTRTSDLMNVLDAINKKMGREF
jgi:hypothetical protein